MTQISHKHRALQILPEHYPIVGKHLIGAIKEVLGEAATDDIITAWTEAYDEIASVFIQIEHGMYEEANFIAEQRLKYEPQNKKLINQTLYYETYF